MLYFFTIIVVIITIIWGIRVGRNRIIVIAWFKDDHRFAIEIRVTE